MTTMLPQQPDTTTYTFTSQPRAVKPRKKYRDPVQQTEQKYTDGTVNYGNIMYDRRVVRGNTYAQQILPTHAQPDPIELQRQRENRRRALARRRAKEQFRPRSPDAVEGRLHVAVQTELYLEELTDRVEEADVECQTDAFLDRPPSPLFIPAKSGIDIETQILEGDLFDFDLEVKPILEVIVGKTIEQSLLEVMEEEELANLRQQQREFEELRNAELVEQQRLEEKERRHREEKERRMKERKEVLQKEKDTAEKIAARAYAHGYLADLLPSVFGTLTESGYFFDAIERDVELNFMPWLMDEVVDHLETHEHGRLVLDGVLRDVVRQRTEIYNKLEQEAAKKVSLTTADVVSAKQSATDVPPPSDTTATDVPPPSDTTATDVPPPSDITATDVPPPSDTTATTGDEEPVTEKPEEVTDAEDTTATGGEQETTDE